MIDNENAKKSGLTRADFIKAAPYMLGGLYLALYQLLHPGLDAYAQQLEEASFQQDKAIGVNPDTYFKNRGIRFNEGELGLRTKDVKVYYDQSIEIDHKKLESIFSYFENQPRTPFEHTVTDSGKRTKIIPLEAKWQKKGNIYIIPFNAGLPSQFDHLKNNFAFTDYSESGDHFDTYIRIPTEEQAKQMGLNIQQLVQMSATIEAAQTSVYVNLSNSLGLGLPLTEERIIAQEGFANSYWYALYYRFLNYPYDPLLFVRTKFPSMPASNGSTYNLNSIFLSKQQYNSLPVQPFIKSISNTPKVRSGKKQ